MTTQNVTPIERQESFPLIDRVLAERNEAGLSEAQIAREIDVSASALNQLLKGSYKGNKKGLESKLENWLNARAEKAAELGRMPEAPGHVKTPSAERIISACSYAQMAADIAVVYGAAGVGKTETAIAYQASYPGVHLVTMTPATASAAACLEEIGEVLGISQAGAGPARLQRAIIRRLKNTQGLLIIDEAQHLHVQALDAVRGLHDAAGIGIALLGNEAVYTRMTGGHRAAYLDRLYSRIGKRTRVAKPAKGDIDALIKAWGVTGAGAKRLLEIGQQPGGLRGITKVMRLASLFAGDASPGAEDIRAAWRDLGGEG